MEIQVPEKFTEILALNDALNGAVRSTLAEFEPWLRLSAPPFFPEYTDHGPKHLADTMATSAAIIRDEAWPFVTPADVAELVAAIVLHDCAMHITEDGFISLVNPAYERPTITGFGDSPWRNLWSDFLGDASRFDARKLLALFGDTEPVSKPSLDSSKWTSRDKRLIGEFLRRHHPRLAHEVALWGVPGPTNKPLRLIGFSEDLADIAGLLARSHGQSIRSCLPYLQRFDIRDFKGVHAIFLMTVLRIADYMQVTSDRAPEQVLRVRRLKSPVSQGEWDAHDAVRDIRHTHEDPEAVFIDAAPKDVKTFLRLKNLLTGIQEELDASWAALGEVYSRYGVLNQLGLKLRRVRSNLDDEQTFAASVPYIPCETAFKAAESDLLGLLVGPLYGNRPEIGIRELVQNAVDACRELHDYLVQRPDSHPDLPNGDEEVVVTLQEDETEGTGWLEVADSGIGMTAEIVRNYFLSAGASFRRSDVWRRLHEDAPGKSRVLRSGRFGIGVLASFLLGDEVDVSTRHVGVPENDGLRFTARIDSSEIELLRHPRPVGTTVRIRISNEKVWNTLTGREFSYENGRFGGEDTWDWFCLSNPKVRRKIAKWQKKPQILKQAFYLPLPGSALPQSWHRISCPGYLDIQWTYEVVPQLSCNGIRVLDALEDYYYTYYDSRIGPLLNDYQTELKCPNVSVFDPNGHLPLLLQRTALATKSYPFHTTLLNDVIKNLFAFILVHAPEGPITESAYSNSFANWYPGFVRRQCDWLPLFSLSEGSSLIDLIPLRANGFDRVLLVPSLNAFTTSLKDSGVNSKDTIVPLEVWSGDQARRRWFRCALGGGNEPVIGPAADLTRLGSRMLLREKTLKEFQQPGLISRHYWQFIREEFHVNGWVLLRWGKCPTPGLDFEKLAGSGDEKVEGLAEWYLRPERPDTAKLSRIAQAWQEIVGIPVIPFDPHERRRKLSAAFNLLKDHVAEHEKLKERASSTNNGDNEGHEVLAKR